jgi:RHS repeat-associated protein
MDASFRYDALNRRIEKTINGRTTQYLYDGLDIIQEIEDGMVTANYIRSLNIDEPLARVDSLGGVRFYHTDALGSVIALTDELGEIKTQYNYTPFGTVEVMGEESDNPFQYTGRENDGTGLMYYRARYYSPEMKRFISEDPIGMLGGYNFYSYVGNGPVNWVDPFGLWTYPTTCGVRVQDAHGFGHFGASREGGTRPHEGIDYGGKAGSDVYAPMGGKLVKFKKGAIITGRIDGVEYSTLIAHIDVTAKEGEIKEGAVIGTVQDLTGKYQGIINHAHVELYMHINGKKYLRDPSDYIPSYSISTRMMMSLNMPPDMPLGAGYSCMK